MAQQAMEIIVGVDVCKARLEVFEHGSERAYAIDNDAAAIAAWLEGMQGRLKVAMEPTLAQALQVVFGGAPETVAGAAPPMAEAAGLDQAREALDAAQQALAKGDWAAFGAAMQRLRDRLGPQPAAARDGSASQ